MRSPSASPLPVGASCGAIAALLGSVVAGGLELGRAAAPVSLVDEATLGGALTVSRPRTARRGREPSGRPARRRRPRPRRGAERVGDRADAGRKRDRPRRLRRRRRAPRGRWSPALGCLECRHPRVSRRARRRCPRPLGRARADARAVRGAARGSPRRPGEARGRGARGRQPRAPRLRLGGSRERDRRSRAPLGGRGVLRGDCVRAPGARRGRLCPRVRSAPLPPPRALDPGMGCGGLRSRSADGSEGLPCTPLGRPDLGDRPVQPRDPRPSFPNASLERDPQRAGLAVVAGRLVLDTQVLVEDPCQYERSRSSCFAPSAGSRSQRKKVRSAASLRTRRSGSVSRSQREIASSPASVTA